MHGAKKSQSQSTKLPFPPLTKAQVDELFDRLKRGLGEFSVLNDVIFKHLFGEPGKAERRLMSLLNAVRQHAVASQLASPSVSSAVVARLCFFGVLSLFDTATNGSGDNISCGSTAGMQRPCVALVQCRGATD